MVPSIWAVSGMMLLTVPATILPTVTTAGVEDVDPPGDHRLQRLHDLARNRNGVQGAVWLAGMTAPTLHRDEHRVGGAP